MILKNDQKEEIVKRIDFIQIQLDDLNKSFRNLSWETYSTDRDIQRNVERLAENVANASIDISTIILSGEDTEMPTHQYLDS